MIGMIKNGARYRDIYNYRNSRHFIQTVREARKSNASFGVGTKSQQALKLQHEELKKETCQNRRIQKAKKAEFLFELRQQKRKEKHRGK